MVSLNQHKAEGRGSYRSFVAHDVIFFSPPIKWE